jgi:hypothetical protein
MFFLVPLALLKPAIRVFLDRLLLPIGDPFGDPLAVLQNLKMLLNRLSLARISLGQLIKNPLLLGAELVPAVFGISRRPSHTAAVHVIGRSESRSHERGRQKQHTESNSHSRRHGAPRNQEIG